MDFKPSHESNIASALYDPDFATHTKMLRQAKDYLTKDGLITLTHANLQSGKTENPNKDFELLEALILGEGYTIVSKKASEALGYTWVAYKIEVAKKYET